VVAKCGVLLDKRCNCLLVAVDRRRASAWVACACICGEWAVAANNSSCTCLAA
jgi:hypothetical protein